MNFLSLIPGFSFFRLGVAAVIIAVAVGAAWKWRHSGVVQGRAEIQAQWDAEKLDIAKQTLRVYENNTRTEQNLIASSETTRRTKDARIAQLDANLIIALNGLRDRPERPSNPGLPTPAGNGGCTGAGLFRPDSEFLTRLAGHADKLRTNLAACYERYDAAREALK